MQDAMTYGAFKIKPSTLETHVSGRNHTEKAMICLSRKPVTSQSRAQESGNIKYTTQNLLNSPVYRNRDI